MTTLSISHTTRYTFSEPVLYGLQQVRLCPLTGHTQTVEDWTLDVAGGKLETSYKDHYGNHVDLVSATPGTTELVLNARGIVAVADTQGVLGQVYGRAPLWHFSQQTPLTTPNDGILEMADELAVANTALEGLHALSATILETVAYETGQTRADTTAAEAVALGKGVCQDHAHIFISAARAAGLPARYVSGYLRMKDRVDQDASHAWAEAHVDDLGWVSFDISSGICTDDNHVRIAIGRDASDCAPVSGLRMGPGNESLIVSLQVQQ